MRIFETCGSVRRQPAKAAAEPSRFHPITVVVSPRRGSGDPAKPLFYPGRGSGTSKRPPFRPDETLAGRQKCFYRPDESPVTRQNRFYHPDEAAAAPNDCLVLPVWIVDVPSTGAAAAPNDCLVLPGRHGGWPIKPLFPPGLGGGPPKTTFVLPAAPKFSADSPDFRRFSLQTINHQL